MQACYSALRARASSLALGLVVMLAGAGCAADGHWYFSADEHEHDWGYEGEIGPEHWGSLSLDYRLADEGREQSPVDIVPADAPGGVLPSLDLRYHATNAHWVNDGHTLEHSENEDNHLLFGGLRYDLMQYHLHTPSEHTIDGLHAPAEMHYVHRDASGRVLVVAVLVSAGDAHEELELDVDDLPLHAGDEADLLHWRDPLELFPDDRSYWQYAGSFTTPPCTEGVTWIVLRERLRVTPRVLRKIASILGRNNRPVMPLNGRVVMSSVR